MRRRRWQHCTLLVTPWLYKDFNPQPKLVLILPARKDGSLSQAICPGVELNRCRYDWACTWVVALTNWAIQADNVTYHYSQCSRRSHSASLRSLFHYCVDPESLCRWWSTAVLQRCSSTSQCQHSSCLTSRRSYSRRLTTHCFRFHQVRWCWQLLETTSSRWCIRLQHGQRIYRLENF